jgi:hypothetical protein
LQAVIAKTPGDKEDEYETFLKQKLNKNRSFRCLHCPSSSFEFQFPRENIFCTEFDSVKQKVGIHRRLLTSCRSKLAELCASGVVNVESAVCCRNTVLRGTAPFLRIMIYHSVKAENRSMGKAQLAFNGEIAKLRKWFTSKAV